MSGVLPESVNVLVCFVTTLRFMIMCPGPTHTSVTASLRSYYDVGMSDREFVKSLQ